MRDLANLSTNLRRLRAERRLRLLDVGPAAEMKWRTVQDWEAGRFGNRGPGLLDLVRLARFYNVSIEWLLTDHRPVAAAVADE